MGARRPRRRMRPPGRAWNLHPGARPPSPRRNFWGDLSAFLPRGCMAPGTCQAHFADLDLCGLGTRMGEPAPGNRERVLGAGRLKLPLSFEPRGSKQDAGAPMAKMERCSLSGVRCEMAHCLGDAAGIRPRLAAGSNPTFKTDAPSLLGVTGTSQGIRSHSR